MPTYKQQFDKLTEAYIRGEVHPFSGCRCLVGNLLNNKPGWYYCKGDNWGEVINKYYEAEYFVRAVEVIKQESDGLYTPEEIVQLEYIFMKACVGGNPQNIFKQYYNDLPENIQEENLFNAFELSLEELKRIHISKGEVIDDVPVFKKRELIPA